LLPERQPSSAAPAGKSKDPAVLGPGLRVLVLNKNGAAPQHVPGAGRRHGASVKASLILADLVIVAMIVLWRRSAGHALHFSEALFCVCAILFGGWLTCLAAWLQFDRDP
jgi:hypothetical protein